MLVDDVLKYNNRNTDNYWDVIKNDCSKFITESNGIPVYKTLPNNYSDLHRVKVRFKRKEDAVSGVFDKAFINETYSLSNRSVYAYPHIPQSNLRLESNLDLFYIFPIDGYKFLYSKEVVNATNDYKSVIDTVFNTFDNCNEAIDIVTDLIKYTYNAKNLYEGLTSSAEIIFYNIPYYYAVRVNEEIDYNQLIR